MINGILVAVGVFVYVYFLHELAHAIAAAYYDVQDSVVFLYANDPVLRLTHWGFGIRVEEELTPTQSRVISYAPAIWLPAGGVLYLAGLEFAGIVVGLVGISVISDVITGVMDEDEIDMTTITLYTFQRARA